LLGNTAEQASSAQPSAIPPALLQQLERMEKRLEQLEARLDTLENGAKEKLERAAAAAAARILREELAAMLVEGAA
jgi:flagellar biosynthesis/type III secretory pathway protein FliH